MLLPGLVALGAVSCVLSFQRPTLRVADVRLSTVSLTGGTVAVLVAIENPNDYPLETVDFRYRLALPGEAEGDREWFTLAEGRHAGVVTVPARDTASVQLEVPFSLAPLGTAMSRLLRRGELDYRFSGELQVTAPRHVRVPFDRRGVFRP